MLFSGLNYHLLGVLFANECGCTNPDAINFSLSADGDDGTCIISGCTDELACNFNELANEDFEGQLCDYAEELYDCEGNCIEDIDSDGICDELEVLGCTNSDADNFNPLATEDDSSCYFTIYGCTDESACNYNELANEDFEGQLCDYAEELYDCEGNCVEDIDSDGICDELEVLGCTNSDVTISIHLLPRTIVLAILLFMVVQMNQHVIIMNWQMKILKVSFVIMQKNFTIAKVIVLRTLMAMEYVMN